MSNTVGAEVQTKKSGDKFCNCENSDPDDFVFFGESDAGMCIVCGKEPCTIHFEGTIHS